MEHCLKIVADGDDFSDVLSGTRKPVLNGTRSCSECTLAREKFGVPFAFPQCSICVPFRFHFRSNNVFPVRLLLSGTVHV